MSRRRILIVDDEPGMLRATERILSPGYEVHTSESAEEALAVVGELEPDLAILDIRMPGIDGFQLMRRLRDDGREIDVILMTGSVADTDKKLIRAMREKAFYFVQKPFDRDVLRTLVERCLELRRLGEENRAHVARLEAELAQARTFQRGLLPAPSATIGRVRIEALNLACDELCGDFYDYARAEGAAVTFLVADVAGHGASAAMLTGVVKSTFQASHLEGYEPRAIAASLARNMTGFMAHRFVTLFCGRVDPEQGSLEYVNAGHPPALVRDTRGEFRLLASTGPIVSPALDTTEWRQERVDLAQGERIFVYTDGVTEAEGGDGELELDGFQSILASVGDDPSGLLDRVVAGVREHSKGRPFRDDLTLMTVDLGGAGR